MKNYVTTVGIAFSLALPHVALAQVVMLPPVPTNIEVLARDQAILVGHAFGTPNYECQPANTLGRAGWLSTHFFGPNPHENSGDTLSKTTFIQRVKATVAPTSACPGIIPVGGVSGRALVIQRSKEMVAPMASVEGASFMQNVDFAPFTLRTVKGDTPALRPAIPSGLFSHPSRSDRSGRPAAKSTKGIIAGAITGVVGGFFGGGFLGAHIEGDRCFLF